MSLQLTPEQLAVYRQTARLRWQARRKQVSRRRLLAWGQAQQVAVLLKREYGASRVIVFGSLAHRGWFHDHSDIDLAVEGLAPGAVWKAWGAAERLLPGFSVDLLELETATEPLRRRIEEHGKAL